MDFFLRIFSFCLGIIANISLYIAKKQKLIGFIVAMIGFILMILVAFMYQFEVSSSLIKFIITIVGGTCVVAGMIKPIILSVKGMSDVFRNKKE
jgi:hypothetical protein